MIKLTLRSLIGSDLVIVLVSSFHLFEAWVIATTPTANGSIGVAALLAAFGEHRWLCIFSLTVAALLAATGQWVANLTHAQRIPLLLPQLALLIVTSSSAVEAILLGSYADGVLRHWQFIACDQAPRVMMPFLYAIATYVRVRPQPSDQSRDGVSMVDPLTNDRSSRRLGFFRYNPEVTAGHVMTAILVVGVLVTGYMWFRVDMASQINAVRVDMTAHEARLTTAERALIERRDEERQFATEMRAALVEIQKALNDLNLQLVKTGRSSK